MQEFILFLQSLPPFVVSICMFIVAYGTILLFGAIAGKHGIYCAIIVAIIGANIQVLKATQFSFFGSPVALGTELFAATYLATDILTELYGPKTARTGVFLGFLGMFFWALISVVTLGFAPIQADTGEANAEVLLGMHDHLEAILLPVPTFLLASIVAYLVSQLLDIYLFSYIKRKTKNKYLWLRNNLSTMISALIDNTIFSVLAWIVLSSSPLPLVTVIKTYILGTYIFRVAAALFDTPMIYLARKVVFVKSNFP